MEDNLKVLEQFFDTDIELKKMMADSAPSFMDSFDTDSIIKYYSKLYRILQYAKSKLALFFQSDFFVRDEYLDLSVEMLEDGTVKSSKQKSNAPESFYNKINEIKNHLMELEASLRPPEQAFRECFSDMNKSFVDDVRSKIYGENDLEMAVLAQTMDDSTTINELLHVIHTHVENSNRILGSIPVIDKKETTIPNTNQVLKSLLLGEPNNELARSIFEQLPVKTRYAYVVGLEDKTLLMVRDVGHALTMQITEENDGHYTADYFIPKVTDADAIANLPAEQQTLDYNNGIAYGKITMEKDNAAKMISSFIGMVPGDEGISAELLMTLIRVKGNLERALSLVHTGIITPRNLLLYSNFAGLNVDDELKTKLLSMAEDMDKNDNKTPKKEDDKEI